VVEHLGLLHAIDDFVVLSASNTADIGGNSGVNRDVFFNIVLVWLKTTKDKESAAGVKLMGILPQEGRELGKWKRCLIDMAD
jgi:hypothetical protein